MAAITIFFKQFQSLTLRNFENHINQANYLLGVFLDDTVHKQTFMYTMKFTYIQYVVHWYVQPRCGMAFAWLKGEWRKNADFTGSTTSYRTYSLHVSARNHGYIAILSQNCFFCDILAEQ
jgi:hypothetical protein